MRWVGLTACATAACMHYGDRYSTVDVDVESAKLDASGTLRLSYRVLLETAWFSPGANIRREGQDCILSIVRCRIGERCAVDVASTIASGPGVVHRLEVHPETPVERVYLDDGKTRRELVVTRR